MLRRLLLALLFVAVFFDLAAPAVSTAGRQWWSYVEFLASDKLEGRLTGSLGHRQAAEFVAQHFRQDGLEPAGTQGYIQPVGFLSRTILEQGSSLALVREGKSQPLEIGEDAIASARAVSSAPLDAPLEFVGYGLDVPELNYDDLAHADLHGKIAVFMYGGPASIPGPLRAHYQSLEKRWKSLGGAGALGSIVIFNPHHMDIPWSRLKVLRFQSSMVLADPKLDETPGQKVSILFNPAHADKLLAGSGHSFEEILKLADQGKPLPTFPLSVSLRARVKYDQKKVTSQNILGILPGSDPQLKDEYVVLSAHVDHLGVGAPIHGDKIYNGAMDNAAGVATLLEVAAALHESVTKTRRSLLFVIVTGEEKGLLGSKYFTAHPTVPLERVVADLNVDMFLPLYPLDRLIVYGLEESDLGSLLKSVAESQGVEVQPDPAPERNVFIRSDQYNFIKKGIPSIFFGFGYQEGSAEEAIAKKWLTERYHAPSDDIQQPVDIAAAAKYNQIVLLLTEKIADRTEPPHWNSNSFFKRYVGR